MCCNKDIVELDELRSNCTYECESCEVVRSTNPSSNARNLGQFVSLNETFHKFEKYDLVIHSTPDVYVVDDRHLIALLEEELDTKYINGESKETEAALIQQISARGVQIHGWH